MDIDSEINQLLDGIDFAFRLATSRDGRVTTERLMAFLPVGYEWYVEFSAAGCRLTAQDFGYLVLVFFRPWGGTTEKED